MKPPKRVSVSQAARNGFIVPDASGAVKYEAETTPYMIQPMDALTDRKYEAVIFVGPQRTGKSLALMDCWVNYAIQYDPADMMLLFPGQDLARDYSMRRLDRILDFNEPLRTRLVSGHGNNTYDKRFIAGNIINLSWPSIGQLRQRDIRFAGVTELDSMEDDLNGAGDIFGLLQKRTQTYLSAGKTLAESAPAKAVDLTALENFKPSSDHDCLPAKGVALLYAQSDKRRLYWSCLHCDELFQATMKLLQWDEKESIKETADSVYLPCPHCGGVHHPRDKFELNRRLLDGKGGWFKAGELDGKPVESKIAGFWMEGVAAAFQSWDDLIYRELMARQIYNETGDMEQWKRTLSSDQGIQFVPPENDKSNSLRGIENRAEALEKRQVADAVHFLITTIDQQKNRFVVQVMGYGREGEAWLVDRYNVSQSPNRVGEDGKALTISPFEYPEDWDALEKVIDRVYLAQSGAEMKSVKVLCDSGGKDDATNNAYRFWKKYAKDGKNAGVFWLIKGRDTGERLVKSETVLNQSGVPLWLLNVHRLKDESMFALGREEPGPRYVHFPQWLGDWFYEELRSEVKDAKTGKWDKRRKKMNNEAWDLLSYGWAGYTMAGGEKINFDSPPPWAIRADKRIIKAPATAQFNWATIGKTLNG